MEPLEKEEKKIMELRPEFAVIEKLEDTEFEVV